MWTTESNKQLRQRTRGQVRPLPCRRRKSRGGIGRCRGRRCGRRPRERRSGTGHGRPGGRRCRRSGHPASPPGPRWAGVPRQGTRLYQVTDKVGRLWKTPKLNQVEPGLRIRLHGRGTNRIPPWLQFHPQMVLRLHLGTRPSRVEQDRWPRHVPKLLRLPGGLSERDSNAGEKFLLRFGGAPPHEKAVLRKEGRRGGVVTEDQGLRPPDRQEAGIPADAAGSVVVGFRLVAVCAGPRRQDYFGHDDQRPTTGLHPLDRTWICIPRHARKLQAVGDNDHGPATPACPGTHTGLIV